MRFPVSHQMRPVVNSTTSYRDLLDFIEGDFILPLVIELVVVADIGGKEFDSALGGLGVGREQAGPGRKRGQGQARYSWAAASGFGVGSLANRHIRCRRATRYRCSECARRAFSHRHRLTCGLWLPAFLRQL